MGYCMTQAVNQTRFRIDKGNKAGALAAIKALASVVEQKGSGGTFQYGRHTSHFSWVTTGEFLGARTLEEALEAWRWECEVDQEGNIVDLHFVGEKLGDDDVVFDAIAPFVLEGSKIVMVGEDGDIFGWVFDGTTADQRSGQITL